MDELKSLCLLNTDVCSCTFSRGTVPAFCQCYKAAARCSINQGGWQLRKLWGISSTDHTHGAAVFQQWHAPERSHLTIPDGGNVPSFSLTPGPSKSSVLAPHGGLDTLPHDSSLQYIHSCWAELALWPSLLQSTDISAHKQFPFQRLSHIPKPFLA